MTEITEINYPHDILDILSVNRDFDNWSRYGHVNTKTEGNYILFNYSAQAQYEGRWNEFEIMSRGLIIDKRQLIIMARPFDKFFNFGEGGRRTDSRIEHVMEKMDGSLGICWFDPLINDWRITTRGSFDSDQAQWATEFLHTKYGHRLDFLNHWNTYLFEIIYPKNRIVVDYGNKADLFLLAIRDRETGEYVEKWDIRASAKYIGCPAVKFRDDIANNQDAMLILYKAISEIKGVEKEGFVTIHKDGSRWKFKGADYLRIHKVISSFSFKHTLEAIAKGAFDEWIESIPDEFLGDIRQWKVLIEDEYQRVLERCYIAFNEVEKLASRKEQAQFILQHYKDVSHFVFRMLDDKFETNSIYKKYDFSHLESVEE